MPLTHQRWAKLGHSTSPTRSQTIEATTFRSKDASWTNIVEQARATCEPYWIASSTSDLLSSICAPSQANGPQGTSQAFSVRCPQIPLRTGRTHRSARFWTRLSDGLTLPATGSVSTTFPRILGDEWRKSCAPVKNTSRRLGRRTVSRVNMASANGCEASARDRRPRRAILAAIWRFAKQPGYSAPSSGRRWACRSGSDRPRSDARSTVTYG